MIEQKQLNIALACVINSGKVLLTKRLEPNQPDIDGLWELPGGKVEFGESPIQTVLREVKEETGCIISNPTGLPFPFIALRNYNQYLIHVIIFCFECNLISTPCDFSKYKKGKVSDIQWFNVCELDLMQVMAGSREFLCWTVHKKLGKVLKDSDGSFFSYISFECYKPEENHKKFYFINISFNPNATESNLYQLKTAWGRISSRERLLSSIENSSYSNLSNIKIEKYSDVNQMHIQLENICQKRIDHGYSIVDHKPNFPLRQWLQNNHSFIKRPVKQAKQLILPL